MGRAHTELLVGQHVVAKGRRCRGSRVEWSREYGGGEHEQTPRRVPGGAREKGRAFRHRAKGVACPESKRMYALVLVIVPQD